MPITRREALALGLAAASATATATAGAQAGAYAPAWPRDAEGRRQADLGDGRFLNPVLAGDHPDPTLLRDGDDYYATFSSFDATPGIVLWHSRDLVNWAPIGPALAQPPGIVFACDLVKHGGRYFIYIPFIPASWSTGLPRAPSIWVIHADDMRGPWSEPIDLGLRGVIDPGHVLGEDGRRYLYVSGGACVRLRDDGLATDGPLVPSYQGWKYPDEWITEAYSLEGPKLFRRGEWFYLVSAVGGTSGPATGHMVTVARSRSVLGPWQECPHNPIVRTHDEHEGWWSRGHATMLEGPGGQWWMGYHGYEAGYRSLGRQFLLEPVAWSADGWPRAMGGDLSRPLPMPPRAPLQQPAWSDDFAQPAFGTRWNFFAAAPGEAARAHFDGGGLKLAAKGTSPADCSPLVGPAGDRAWQCEVIAEAEPGAQAALLLYFNQRLYLGMGIDGEAMATWAGGTRSFWSEPAPRARRLHLRLTNDRQLVTMHYSEDGERWLRHGLRLEVSGYNANTMRDLQSLRPALAAIGTGHVRFSRYRYRGLG